MNAKRILALILTAILLGSSLVACNDNPDTPDTPDVSDTDTPSSTPEDTTPEDKGLVLDVTDFGGTNLRVHGMSMERNYGYYSNDDIWVESDSADPFASAVYKRMQDCINKYNFGVTYTDSQWPNKERSEYVAGGLDLVDVMFDAWGGMYNAALAGELLDLKDVTTMDLSNEWYDQNAIADLTIANRTFYTCGDISITDEKGLIALYFNKTLANNKSLESPYELVANNQWTWDKFTEMCRAAAEDVNGDGLDEDDIVGMFTVSGHYPNFMLAVGEKYATLDADGKPEYTWLDTSDAITKLETVAGFMIEYGTVYNGHTYSAPAGNIWGYGRAKFASGKHLFTFGGSNVITEFADMEDDFGIIPMPKWNADQSRYYHTVDTSTAFFCLPNTKVDTTQIGYMIEYFSYEGLNTITPTFKEKMLKRRYAQDSESGDMLDLIYSSKAFDIGHNCNWNDVVGLGRTQIQTGRIPKLSGFNRVKESVKKNIEEDYLDYLNVGKEVPSDTDAVTEPAE